MLFLCSGLFAQNIESRSAELEAALDQSGKLKPGINGSFNAQGYEMQYGKNGEPVFKKTNSPNETQTITWSALGSGVGSSVYAIAVAAIVPTSIDVYVGGAFTTAGGSPANYIAKWNGTSWSALGSGLNSFVFAIAVSGSDVYVGGNFTTAGGISANRIAKWNGTDWSALGTGMDNKVYAIAVSGSDVYVGGAFTTAGGSSAILIAKWNGSSWSALGSGVNGQVNAIAVSGSDVYVGGAFTTAGGISANRIAKWNGSSWSSLGSGTNTTVSALAVNTYDGKMMVGGLFTTVDGSISANYVASFTDSENPFPITLASFTGTVVNGNNVLLEWMTISEVNNYGFYVERRAVGEPNFVVLPNSFVPGHGTTIEPQYYSWTHENVAPGTYEYRLQQVDMNGSISHSFPVEVTVSGPLGVRDGEVVPAAFKLNQNYPNPFNPTTRIGFSLPAGQAGIQGSGFVSLQVYDVLGQEVASLVSGELKAGSYETTFDAHGLASGVYFYRLSVVPTARRDLVPTSRDGQAGEFTQTKRLSLLR